MMSEYSIIIQHYYRLSTLKSPQQQFPGAEAVPQALRPSTRRWASAISIKIFLQIFSLSNLLTYRVTLIDPTEQVPWQWSGSYLCCHLPCCQSWSQAAGIPTGCLLGQAYHQASGHSSCLGCWQQLEVLRWRSSAKQAQSHSKNILLLTALMTKCQRASLTTFALSPPVCVSKQAKFGWGAECKQYDTMITAETGLVGPSPAARLRVAWNELPSAFKHYAKKYTTSYTLLNLLSCNRLKWYLYISFKGCIATSLLPCWLAWFKGRMNMVTSSSRLLWLQHPTGYLN